MDQLKTKFFEVLEAMGLYLLAVTVSFVFIVAPIVACWGIAKLMALLMGITGETMTAMVFGGNLLGLIIGLLAAASFIWNEQ